MGRGWARQIILACAVLGFSASGASANNDLLAKLRKEGTIKVGIVNGLPYSIMNPDGTLGGFTPKIVGIIMNNLGVPKMEGVAVTYGALIPGLSAGRWDMIAGSLSISKARCAQVTYSDPTLIDRSAVAYVPADLSVPPQSIKDIAQRSLRVGLLTGTVTLPFMQEQMSVGKGTITQYPDTGTLVDGLTSKRVDVVFSGSISLRDMKALRGGNYEIVYPIPDGDKRGSAPAFRPVDTDLIDAFQAELRKLKKSGEVEKIVREAGFDVQPGDLDITNEQACAESIL